MITAALHPLTRRALSAAPHWLPATRVEDRRRIAGWCELSDAECAALDQLRENLRAAAQEPRWFDEGKERLRADIAQRLTHGLLVAERDCTEFLRLLRYPDRTLVFTIAYAQCLEKGVLPLLKPRWVARAAATAQEDRIRTEQRVAREQAQAEAQAVAAAERQRQIMAEFEQRQQAGKAKEKTMETATLNGNSRLEIADDLTDFQRAVLDEVRSRSMNPRVNLSHATVKSIARTLSASMPSVEAALGAIRTKLRGEAGQMLQEMPDAPPVAIAPPVEERVAEWERGGAPLGGVDPAEEQAEGPTVKMDSAAIVAEARGGEPVEVLEPSATDPAPQVADPRIAELEEQVERLKSAVAAWAKAATAATEDRDRTATMAAGLETQLEQVITERAAAWEQLHELKNAAAVPTEAACDLTDGERRLALDLAAGCDVTDHNADRSLDGRAEILRLAREAVLAVLR